jgi:hypothetical protein
MSSTAACGVANFFADGAKQETQPITVAVITKVNIDILKYQLDFFPLLILSFILYSPRLLNIHSHQPLSDVSHHRLRLGTSRLQSHFVLRRLSSAALDCFVAWQYSHGQFPQTHFDPASGCSAFLLRLQQSLGWADSLDFPPKGPVHSTDRLRHVTNPVGRRHHIRDTPPAPATLAQEKSGYTAVPLPGPDTQPPRDDLHHAATVPCRPAPLGYIWPHKRFDQYSD